MAGIGRVSVFPGTKQPSKPSGIQYEPGNQIDFYVAIDFGTTRSEVAYTIVNSSKKALGSTRSIDIAYYWAGSSEEIELLPSDKTDTVIIYNMNENNKFEIGLRAYLENRDMENFYEARDFKMLLDVKTRREKGEKNIKLKETEVKLHPMWADGSERKKLLFDVVRDYLMECGNVAWKRLEAYSLTKGCPPPKSKSEIHWVVTVPAIWTDMARIFMREASNAAGLVLETFSKNISICLEPEGATLAGFFGCEQQMMSAVSNKIKDSVFIVIDLGGGTADITVQKVETFTGTQVQFEEVCPPSGGPWGGRKLTRNFNKMVIKKLLTTEEYKKYKKYDSVQLEFFAKEFKARTTWSGDTNTDMRVDLGKLIVDLKQRGIPLDLKIRQIMKSNPIAGVKFPAPTKIDLSPVFLTVLFESVLNPLQNHLSQLINSLKEKPKFAFIVGGMGSSPFIQSKLKEFLQNHKTCLIIPPEPSLAIVQGAVRFGLDSQSFGSRKARTNYGMMFWNKEDEQNPIFTQYIKKGELLQNLENQKPLGPFSPVSPNQTEVSISWHETDSEDVKYTTDPRCIEVASIVMPMDMKVPFEQREVYVKLSMSGTVISGIVKNATSNKEIELKWSSR